MNDTTMPSWTPQTETTKESLAIVTPEPPAPRKRTRKPTPSAVAPKVAANVAAPRKRAAKKKASAKKAAKKTAPKKKAAKPAQTAPRAPTARAPAVDFATVLGVGSLLKSWQVEALVAMLKTLHGIKPKDRPVVIAALKRLA